MLNRPFSVTPARTRHNPDFVSEILKIDRETCAFASSDFAASLNSDLGDAELIEMALLGGSIGSIQQPVHVVTSDPYESVVARLKVARFALRNLQEMVQAAGLPEGSIPETSWHFGYVTIIDRRNFRSLTLDVSTDSNVNELWGGMMRNPHRMIRNISFSIWRKICWIQKD